MTAFDVYLLSVVGSIANFFGIVTGCSFIFFIVFLITLPIWLDGFGMDIEDFPFRKVFLWFVPSWLVCAFLALAIPDTKTLVAMYGVSYITQIEGAKDVPPELVKFIKKYMADYIKEDK